MRTQTTPKNTKRRRKEQFSPNHEFVSTAMEKFLKKGGKIKKLKSITKHQEKDINRYRSAPSANVLSVF